MGESFPDHLGETSGEVWKVLVVGSFLDRNGSKNPRFGSFYPFDLYIQYYMRSLDMYRFYYYCYYYSDMAPSHRYISIYIRGSHGWGLFHFLVSPQDVLSSCPQETIPNARIILQSFSCTDGEPLLGVEFTHKCVSVWCAKPSGGWSFFVLAFFLSFLLLLLLDKHTNIHHG